MPRGRIGADLDDMFDAADEAGGTLTAQIYEDRSYDGVPVLRQAQKRYRARCAAAAAAEAAADDEAAATPAKRRKTVPPVTARAGVTTLARSLTGTRLPPAARHLIQYRILQCQVVQEQMG